MKRDFLSSAGYGIACLFLLVFCFFSCRSDLPTAPAAFEFSGSPSADNQVAERIHKSGHSLLKANKYYEAVDSFEASLSIRKAILEEYSFPEQSKMRDTIQLGVIRSYYNIGLSYYDLGRYQQSEHALNTCLSFFETFENENRLKSNARKAWLFLLFGQLYQESRGIEESFSKYQQAAQYFRLADDEWGVADAYSDASTLFLQWRDQEKIIEYAEKALAIYKKLVISTGIGRASQNAAVGYMYDGDLKQAIAYLDTAYLYHNLTREETSGITFIAKVFHNKALVLRLMESYPDALVAIDSAITINTALNPLNNSVISLAKNYSNKADIYLDMGNLSDAKRYYEWSIVQYGRWDKLKAFPESFAFPKPEDVTGDKVGYIEAVTGRANVLLAMGRTEAALDNYDKAITLVNAFRKDFRDQASRVELAEITRKIFTKAIALNVHSNPERALAYAEQSKSFTLLEAVRHYKSFAILGIESDLLEEENNLRIEIANLDREYRSAESTSAKINLLEQKKAFQDQLKLLQQRLEQNPNYRKLMAASPTIPAKEIQTELLAEDQAMIEYFVGEDTTFIFYLSPDQPLRSISVPIDRKKLQEAVESMLYAIYLPFIHDISAQKEPRLSELQQQYKSMDAGQITYAQKAHRLYQQLIEPVSQQFGPLPERLLIIPDDILGLLPFDALLTQAPGQIGDYRNYPFLGKQRATSFCYSAALLKEMKGKQSGDARRRMLAYLNPEDEFQPGREVLRNQLSGGLVGRRFFNELPAEQPERALIDKAKKYQYLHFYTHGVVNNQEPNFSFLAMPGKTTDRENVLYLYEIYNIPLDARLVVTGACETAVGQLFQGEGIMSLARGFSYAGAKSIVTTLWQVKDSETNEINNNFYRHLFTKEVPIDRALHQAKKDYLTANKPQLKYHPYFWSSMIPIGDMEGA